MNIFCVYKVLQKFKQNGILAKCISRVDLCLNYVIMLNNYSNLPRRAKAYLYLEILALKFLTVEAEHCN